MSKKKQSLEGIKNKKIGENLGNWYKEVLEKSGMIDYYDVSGCYVLRPWVYGIWEKIQQYFQVLFTKSGVKNCYFPLFVTQGSLKREEENFEGFKAEVAWVTKSGSSDLAEPIALRPTSECVMYPYFAKWIRSHRDLPLRLNQWCNVVRWEFSNPVPFIRSREFLWQEGHTAFETKEEADKEVIEILNYYKQVYEDLLAVPVRRGLKTEKEKFPGAVFTLTVEAFVKENGRSIQAGTSHSLGQKFSKMFDITFSKDEKGDEEKSHVWQNSWGFSTRSLGAMILIHGDDKGLVLPPKVAPIQIVIVTIFNKKFDNQKTIKMSKEVEEDLKNAGFRVKCDIREEKTPGWKYNHWEMKGIPLRIEIGPRDVQKNACVFVKRVDGKKTFGIKREEVVAKAGEFLEECHKLMFEKAKKSMDDNLVQITEWKDFMPNLNKKKILKVPFCLCKDCEQMIKEMSGEKVEGEEESKISGAAKSLCIPLLQEELPKNMKCINPKCGKLAKRWCCFGRSY